MTRRSDITHHSQPLRTKKIRQTMDNAQNHFKNNLRRKVPGLREVFSPEQCQAILFFCPITSRAGTDIDAAMNLLNQVQASTPVFMVILHHTFDHEKIVSDSNNAIKRWNTFAVDCLFYENNLLQCQKNDDAIDEMAQYLKTKDLTSYYCFNNCGKQNLSTDWEAENRPLNAHSRRDKTIVCVIVVVVVAAVVIGILVALLS